MAKQFQYETQQYQEDCIKNIITIFSEIHQNRDFKQIVADHHARNNYHFPIKEAKNIDIMMETGTGKTFVFIKTMFELNRNFGYKKFIILIPSVAIREGTKTNLEDTREYFKEIYFDEKDKEIEVFVYESGKPNIIMPFVSDTDKFSVLVMTPSSFNSDNNLLNKPMERDISAFDKVPKNYLECLKLLDPIIIMDEPHKFKGDAFLTYFEGFNNYFLRFGATFPKVGKDERIIPLSNVAYALDSISAFRQNLVKKIVVYTQDIIQKRDLLAAIENKKAIVNTLTNGIIIRQELGVGGIYNGKSIRKINKDGIVLNDGGVEKIDYNLTDEALRQMIRTAIEIHFNKERELFEYGIKTITLFFMESDVSAFRGENPKIKQIFEEEYSKQRQIIIADITPQSPYLQYLQKDYDADNNLLVHEGYFSGDKGSADEKIKQGAKLILKDKKKLLSIENPARFIFSIWALQEGWDNPNVFTICKLSNQGGEISKLQQIGRGLRICVDQNLKRRTIKEFGSNRESFWKINNLDIVVSNQELGFVEAIQNEILSNSFFISDTFTEQDIIKILKEKSDFNDNAIVYLVDEVLKVNKMIIFKEIIDGQKIYERSPNYYTILKELNLPDEQYKALENLFASDIKNYIAKHADKKDKKKIVVKEKFKREFAELWNIINKNAIYFIENINKSGYDNLVNSISKDIEKIDIAKIFLQTTRKDLYIDRIDKEDAITKTTINSVEYQNKINYFELAHELSNNTKTPLSFVVDIFNRLSLEFKQKMVANNPKQALKEMSEIVKRQLIGDIKTKIHYDTIDGMIRHDDLEFAAGSLGKFQEEITDTNFSLKEEWLFKDIIEYDSYFERDIILKDPKNESIEIFGKLPKLEINTPIGKYNPDFCYALKSNTDKKLILVVESKGYNTSQQIPAAEQDKIDFAKFYFDKLNENLKNGDVKIVFKKRINGAQLASLIHEAMEE